MIEKGLYLGHADLSLLPNIKRPPNIKTGFRRFGFNIRGVSGAHGYDCNYDWDQSDSQTQQTIPTQPFRL